METLFDALRRSKLPEWNKRAPTREEFERIANAYNPDDSSFSFDDLTRYEQDFMCYRLLPCLVRGVYPPPEIQPDIAPRIKCLESLLDMSVKHEDFKEGSPTLTIVK